MGYTFRPAPTLVGALFLVLAGAAVILRAQAAESGKPMALQGVMEELGREMQAVTAAISKEDWALVGALAPKIARHAEPPLAEKMRILAWLGGDAGQFRGLDGRVHDSATAMGEAAMRSDGQAVITAFSMVQQSCLSCHQKFREPFARHFRGERQ